MQAHPFIISVGRRVLVVVAFILALLAHFVLCWLYAGIPLGYALADSCFAIALLFVLGYMFWFVMDVIRMIQANIILSVVALLLWVVLSVAFQYLLYPAEVFQSEWIKLIPLRLFIGVSVWIILLQWYRLAILNHWKTEKLLSEALQQPLSEVVDRIAVKNGTRIHVIPVKDLIYIQACGDYVMLHTPVGEFLKEQTMKSLETHLPSNFVRIHRSFIANVEQIERVELFGKESYQVHLKSGAKLKASASGYKTLKEVLSIV